MSEAMCGLNYWISSRVQIPNPCPILRGRALHLDGSNWLIFRSAFPHAAFARLQRQAGGESGMRYWMNEFAPSAQQGLLEQAAHALKLKLADMVSELEGSIQAADTKLADAATRKDRERQEKNKVSAVKRCKVTLKELEQAAKLYGLTAGFNFDAVRNVAVALERSQYRQTEEIARLAEMARGTDMEAAAANDDVPPEILADFVEERGGDVTAARVALGQLTAEQAAQVPTMPDGHTDHEEADEVSENHQEPPPVVVTYARLRDRTWGVRSTDRTIGVGHHVIARRVSGQEQTVRLTGLVRRFPSGVSMWTFSAVEETPAPTPVEAPSEQVEQPPIEAPASEAKPEVTTRFLQRKAWRMQYSVNCKKATITRTFNGQVQETNEMTRDEARKHYAAMVAQGYEEVEF